MFLDEVERIARVSKNLIKEKKVRILSQFDADGITSAAILAKALIREDVIFELTILKQLTSDEIASLEASENDLIILSDFGSGQMDLLKDIIEKTQVIVLDHHELGNAEYTHENLFHLNPLMFGEDEMSASIVCYLFAKFLNFRNIDLIDMALIGATADSADEKWEFKGIIKKIIEESELVGKISCMRGLRLYGRNARPLYRALALSFDPFIPGVSGSESESVQFLSDLGIKVKDGSDWRKLKDLTLEEQQNLASGIVMQRMKTEKDASDIFGDIYTIHGRPEELQDVREFATIINACGRTGRHDVALRILMGDYSVMDECWSVVEGYRKMISDGLKWVRNHPKSVIESEKATFILAKDKISDNVIGTVSTIVVNSDMVNRKKPLFGLAHSADGKVKISGRVSKALKDTNLKDTISDIVKELGGEGGGHPFAAGGLIPISREEDFVKLVGEGIKATKQNNEEELKVK